ncbi:MAG: hypothetical protein GX442_00305 [Candidatus Riflebacteria bacterium]|nr:hypothetical protein [Candidatus Riflebacteria bacterium]
MKQTPMRIELLLACPPTRKCRAIQELVGEAVERYPEQLRVDEYEAGTACPVTPTDGYRRARSGKGKFKKIPSVFVNGVEVAAGEPPERETLFRVIEEQLSQPRVS